jgi:hypothetical protein
MIASARRARRENHAAGHLAGTLQVAPKPAASQSRFRAGPARWHGLCNLTQPNAMNTLNQPPLDDALEPQEVDKFSTSLAPINCCRVFSFGLLERACCVSLLVATLAIMRLFLAK